MSTVRLLTHCSRLNLGCIKFRKIHLRLLRTLTDHLLTIWDQPDEGIWETRGGPAISHSKMMAWVAFDRAIKSAESFGLDGPVEEWRTVRERIHREICEKSFNAQLNSFVQSYGQRA